MKSLKNLVSPVNLDSQMEVIFVVNSFTRNWEKVNNIYLPDGQITQRQENQNNSLTTDLYTWDRLTELNRVKFKRAKCKALHILNLCAGTSVQTIKY